MVAIASASESIIQVVSDSGSPRRRIAEKSHTSFESADPMSPELEGEAQPRGNGVGRAVRVTDERSIVDEREEPPG